VKVPFRLRRRDRPEPAAALWLPSRDVGELLRLCVRLGHDPLPRLHALGDGFLVVLPRPLAGPVAGAVRLRALAASLFVPADADLVPALRDDEAADLAKARGLVFLPGGRVFSFAPDRPLSPAELLAAGSLRRRRWRPLPEQPPLADRLREVILDLPPDAEPEFLRSGGDDIGTEDPLPQEKPTTDDLAARAKMAAGQSMAKLGKMFGLKGLASLGASWMKDALDKVPKLGGLLGRQEAALRALLRMFREGDVDQALRRALPLGEAGGRGNVVSTSDRLPTNDVRYSLNSLVGPPGRGGVWVGGQDVHAELLKEYRKAAEEAAKRGDHRRAAYVYGRLLRDYRMAANCLTAAGLHHDAAVLLLHKVGDFFGAARAFERAGEIDQAVRLYRQYQEHALAGDLLRKAGEEEAALAEYRLAARQLLDRPGQGHLAAGELLLNRVGRPDLALPYFREGWQRRPAPNAVPCALHLARLFAREEKPANLLALADEADAFFRQPGNAAPAGQFYNALARIADQDNLAGIRADLRDRALVGIAVKLRERAAAEARAGTTVSDLLGQAGEWAPAQVSDAQHALAAAVKGNKSPGWDRPVTRFRFLAGPVTAVCAAPASGRVFLGFGSGEVVCFQPGEGRGVPVPVRCDAKVLSLATDADGKIVAVLHATPAPPLLLSVCREGSSGEYGPPERRPWGYEPGHAWLCPLLLEDELTGLWTGNQMVRVIEHSDLAFTWSEAPPAAALLLPAPPQPGRAQDRIPAHRWHLFRANQVWSTVRWDTDFLAPAVLGWTPGSVAGTNLSPAPLGWLQRDLLQVELAAATASGVAGYALLAFDREGDAAVRTSLLTKGEGYLAATVVRPGLVAAVGPARIDWLGVGGAGFKLRGTTRAELRSALACFASQPTRVLVVVGVDGGVAVVPVPT
jgi:tetratricopeptide (TPR) repeat protein